MPKLRLVEMHELDAELRAICVESEQQSGSSASTRVLAHHPGLVKALRTFRGTLAKEGLLEASLKELVRLKIARLNACQYWLQVRYAGARQEGLSEDKIAALDGDTPEMFSARERLAIRFAELLATDHHRLDEAFFAELKRHFTDPEIVELGVTTALFLGLGRFTAVLGVDPD